MSHAALITVSGAALSAIFCLGAGYSQAWIVVKSTELL